MRLGKIINSKRLENSIALVTAIVSFISVIVYTTWYIAGIDKRFAIISQKQRNEETLFLQQENFQINIQTEIQQISNRIDQIYLILLNSKKNNRLGEFNAKTGSHSTTNYDKATV